MKVLLCLALCLVAVTAETCKTKADCQETSCSTEHGWWLHCTQGNCLCSHDTYTGKPCPTGAVSECEAIHGDRCQSMNLVWHCLDGQCHCARH